MFIQILVWTVFLAGCTIPGGSIKASKKRLTEDCKDPDLSQVATTQTLTMCNGQAGTGTMDVST